MRRESARQGVIQADQVRIVPEPVLMGGEIGHEGGITVVPVLDGQVIHALEIRCACGQHMAIECLYEQQAAEPAVQDSKEASETPSEG